MAIRFGRWAWGELRSSRGRHATRLSLVVLILLIGFIGPFLSAAIRGSVADYLTRSSRRLLAADLVINAMRPYETKELEWLKQAFQQGRCSEETEFVTMARGSGVAALVEVKAVDSAFPIYGDFHFETPPGRARSAAALNAEERVAWASSEVLAALGLKLGEEAAIGKSRFRVAAVLKDAPGMGRTAGLAPRLYVGRKFIGETGLTQYGAQVLHRIYLELPAGETIEIASAKIKNALRSADISIRTPDDAIQGFERFFRFFNIYLATVSMVVFVLSWTGAGYVLQIYLRERLPNAAIFMINGASRTRAAALYSLQLLIVTSAAFAVAAGGSAAAVPLLGWLFAERMPEGLQLQLAARDVLALAAVAGLSALAFALPFCLRLFTTPLHALLSENSMGGNRAGKLRDGLAVGVAPIVIFAGVALWMMESWLDAFRLVGGILAVAAFGLFAGRATFRASYSRLRHRPGFARLVSTRLSRSRFGVNLCFLALMLVALASNLIPHLLNSVVGAVAPLEGRELPQLFLFNIPESALANLRDYAARNELDLRYLSPMVLGRLLKVNGAETENDQFQRFPVRLSYRESSIASEQIVAGRAFSGRYDEAKDPVAEISVERRFAERNRLRLGDEIEFEVQSVPIMARIVSLRRVQWTSFHPNFFIVFQPGVLDDAPKSWIANVHLAGGDPKKVKTQFELNREFPDLTALDIGRTINRVLEVARSVIAPVNVSAWFAVAMSFLILFGVIAHNLRLRESELDLEKLLGAERAFIRSLLVAEYAAVAAFAWLVGSTGAFAIAWSVARQVLDVPFQPSGGALAISFIGTLGLTIASSFFLASRVLARGGASSKL